MVKGKPSGYTKEEALERVYVVRGMGEGGVIFVPKSLKEIKVRLKEVEEK